MGIDIMTAKEARERINNNIKGTDESTLEIIKNSIDIAVEEGRDHIYFEVGILSNKVKSLLEYLGYDIFYNNSSRNEFYYIISW